MLGDDAEADDMTYERESDDEGEGEEDKENGAAKLSVKEIALDEFAFDMDKVGLFPFHHCQYRILKKKIAYLSSCI